VGLTLQALDRRKMANAAAPVFQQTGHKMWRRLLRIVLPLAGMAGGLLAGSPPPAVGHDTATTVQLPTFGVAVNAAGVLQVKTFDDPTGMLQAERLRAAKVQQAADLLAPGRLPFTGALCSCC